MDVNVNSADCLRTATNIGYDTVHNICTGTSTNVPWGDGMYLFLAGAALLLIPMALMFAAMAADIVTDVIRRWRRGY